MNGYRILSMTHTASDHCQIRLGATGGQRLLWLAMTLSSTALTWAGYRQWLWIHQQSSSAVSSTAGSTPPEQALLFALVAITVIGLALLTVYSLYTALTTFSRWTLDITPQTLHQSAFPIPQWVRPRQASLNQARATVLEKTRQSAHKAKILLEYHLVIIQPDQPNITLGKWPKSDQVPVQIAQAINRTLQQKGKQ